MCHQHVLLTEHTDQFTLISKLVFVGIYLLILCCVFFVNRVQSARSVRVTTHRI